MCHRPKLCQGTIQAASRLIHPTYQLDSSSSNNEVLVIIVSIQEAPPLHGVGAALEICLFFWRKCFSEYGRRRTFPAAWASKAALRSNQQPATRVKASPSAFEETVPESPLGATSHLIVRYSLFQSEGHLLGRDCGQVSPSFVEDRWWLDRT